MTYLGYDIEFDRLEDLFDLVKPVDICLRFVSALGVQLKSWNFSKQYDPARGEIHPHLSLRLKVLDDPQAKKLIEKTAATIAGEGKLRMFVGPTTWSEEDDTAIKALEAASECAVRMAKLLSRKESSISLEQIRKVYNWDLFVVQLTLKVLDLSGFRVYIRREYRNQFRIADGDLDKLANDLASVWWRTISIGDPDAVEVFVNAFLGLTSEDTPHAIRTF
ncbi:MAG TPA: hypothetical protein VED17_09270, partial [Nitrososphaerales archaeon]|nr:hypothetical protein [Nitrososphaerales archaeon]